MGAPREVAGRGRHEGHTRAAPGVRRATRLSPRALGGRVVRHGQPGPARRRGPLTAVYG
jgi:hypothetical protein